MVKMSRVEIEIELEDLRRRVYELENKMRQHQHLPGDAIVSEVLK